MVNFIKFPSTVHLGNPVLTAHGLLGGLSNIAHRACVEALGTQLHRGHGAHCAGRGGQVIERHRAFHPVVGSLLRPSPKTEQYEHHKCNENKNDTNNFHRATSSVTEHHLTWPRSMVTDAFTTGAPAWSLARVSVSNSR